jgi:CRP-like cAMP-binding protein
MMTCGKRQVYKKDNMILIEEEIGSTMFIILDGRVKISRISDDGEDFLQMLHDYPQIAINLLKELAQRLRRSDAQIKSLSLQNATGKVASTLLRIADDSGKIHLGQVEIPRLPPQQDLANMAGTSRETISRVLKALAKQGYLKKEGSRLIIMDYESFRSEFS